MSNEIIVGLDIGTTKIACFIGQRDEQSGKVRILGYGKVDSSNSVEYGVVKNVRDTAISIGKAVKIASDQASVNVEEVYVGIAGQHIKSRQNQGSIIIPASHTYITEEDIERLKQDQYKILLNPGEEIIHVFPQSFIVDNDILGKPVDSEQASAMLQRLSGRTHDVVTGVCVKTQQRTEVFSCTSVVEFASLSPDEIDHYVSCYRPMDKAGAYGIQEWIGYVGVKGINGSYFNVMGLPIQRLYTLLKTF